MELSDEHKQLALDAFEITWRAANDERLLEFIEAKIARRMIAVSVLKQLRGGVDDLIRVRHAALAHMRLYVSLQKPVSPGLHPEKPPKLRRQHTWTRQIGS